MALSVLKISDLMTSIRDTLQDLQQNRWSEQELFRYLNQGARDTALQLEHINIKHTITVDPLLPNSYDLPYEAIEFYGITSVQPYTYSPTEITFPDNRAEDVLIDYYAYPPEIVYGVTTEVSLERDIQDALKYYVLFRAYEKEDSTEKLAKSAYFYQKYNEVLARNAMRWGNFDQPLSRSDYYTQTIT